MPKPFAELTGNGCHTHLSVWGAAGSVNRNQNLFHDPSGELGLSPLAYCTWKIHGDGACCVTPR